MEQNAVQEPFDYMSACKVDLLHMLEPMFKKGVFVLTNEDKYILRTGMIWNTPWVFAGDRMPQCECILAHQVILKYFNFIPSRCMTCWKVVARPRTVEELFKVSDFQQTSPRPSKAGIEIRTFVHGLYGAYWYNMTIEQGFECKRYVENAFPDIPVILKRGCTEFERKFGTSHLWQAFPEEEDLEALLKSKLVIEDAFDPKQPASVVLHTKRKWIEFAYEHGDGTYSKFTSGIPVQPEMVTYYEKAEDDVLSG